MKKTAMIFLVSVLPLVASAQKASFAELSKAEQIYGGAIASADLKGKVVFLEYWGVNCPPVQGELPASR